MKLPFEIDLKNKVAVVTGGGGVLCSSFAKAIAKCGAKVAILDLNCDAAQLVADEITKDGGIAIGISANVLDKESLNNAKSIINDKLGSVDILLNGAGGNNPKGTTSKEYYNIGDENIEGVKTFFDLDPEGKIFKMMDFTPRGGDVADPWYTGDFKTTYADIEEACTVLFEKLLEKDV